MNPTDWSYLTVGGLTPSRRCCRKPAWPPGSPAAAAPPAPSLQAEGPAIGHTGHTTACMHQMLHQATMPCNGEDGLVSSGPCVKAGSRQPDSLVMYSCLHCASHLRLVIHDQERHTCVGVLYRHAAGYGAGLRTARHCKARHISGNGQPCVSGPARSSLGSSQHPTQCTHTPNPKTVHAWACRQRADRQAGRLAQHTL